MINAIKQTVRNKKYRSYKTKNLNILVARWKLEELIPHSLLSFYYTESKVVVQS